MNMEVNLDKFQSEVLVALKDLTTFNRSIEPQHNNQVFNNFLAKKKAISSSAAKSKKVMGLPDSEKKKLHTKAQNILNDGSVLKYLCPALKELTGDITDVAKNLTIALVPLSLTDVLAIPLDPYLYAMLAFIIGKSGISSLCQNYV